MVRFRDKNFRGKNFTHKHTRTHAHTHTRTQKMIMRYTFDNAQGCDVFRAMAHIRMRAPCEVRFSERFLNERRTIDQEIYDSDKCVLWLKRERTGDVYVCKTPYINVQV